VSLAKRVIACLDVRGGRVVKGRRFEDLRDVGDPCELAVRYEAQGADEIVFLDVSATIEQRAASLDVVRRTAERLFVPLTVGGGMRDAEDAALALRAGADKVALNSAIVARPDLIGECAARFGSQCIVASIDARREEGGWRVRTHGARVPAALDAVEWARACAAHGAGEILITSIDRDGGREGYDLELTRAVVEAVTVPVIASGGAGGPEHVVAAVTEGRADAALIAGVLHDGLYGIADFKRALVGAEVFVRA
jgi:imidazole glycerol-phosphate synthase subunit HisF